MQQGTVSRLAEFERSSTASQDGLVHVSEAALGRVPRQDVLAAGDSVEVMVLMVDPPKANRPVGEAAGRVVATETLVSRWRLILPHADAKPFAVAELTPMAIAPAALEKAARRA
jgi:hypothetical protein